MKFLRRLIEKIFLFKEPEGYLKGDTVFNIVSKKKGFIKGRFDLLSLERYETTYSGMFSPENKFVLRDTRMLLLEKTKPILNKYGHVNITVWDY